MVKKPLTGWRRLALNLFILVHVYIFFFWGLPGSPLRTEMIKPVTTYVNYLGLWHAWNMFAPKPLSTHFDVKGKVKYADGSEAEWIAPRMQELSLFERAAKERHRKWRERIRTDDYKAIWKDTAYYVARQMNNKPNTLPVEVKLSRHWVEIPPPIKGDYQPMPKSFETKFNYTFATIPISHKDL